MEIYNNITYLFSTQGHLYTEKFFVCLFKYLLEPRFIPRIFAVTWRLLGNVIIYSILLFLVINFIFLKKKQQLAEN